jgi:hypothetical protein
MRKSYLLLTLLLFFCATGWSQVTDMGDPISWKEKGPMATPAVETMPAFDMVQQLYEDSVNNSIKAGPWRFGYNHYVDLDLNNSGAWTTLPNGDRVWRIGLRSPDALTINLVFEEFDLPDGAFVYLFDRHRTNRVGAYTSRNNNPEQKLGTELVHGDHIIVEYYEPQAVQGQGKLKIGTVTHGYRELGNYAHTLGNNLMKALNSSGDCNIDVNCPLGSAWNDQIRSVAMIVVGSNGICSGALINNVACDFTPYFLTANHCYSGSIATWSFRFNWESPPGTESCATTANSVDPGAPYDQTSNGGTVRANDSGSDFLLLEMNMSLAEAQSWNVFFAGWDNSETIPTQVTGIHHPSGDVKKICQDNGAVFDTWNFNGDPNTEVWRVNDWTQGVTEPGSSGSPLFDQNGRIIGDLSGGTAACSGTNDNGGYDGYGRFGVSWNGGGSAATRVRDWLDPSNTATTNDGCDPNAPVAADDAGIQSITDPSGAICGTTNFTPSVELRNYGSNTLTSVTINYDVDGGPNQTFNWTGSLASSTNTTVVLPAMTAANGAHVFNASTTLPNGNTDSNGANDASLSNFSILTSGQLIDFQLDLDCWGEEVTWEVQDAATTVLYSGGPYTQNTPNGAGTINDQWCLDVGCYDFIINDTYGDGMYGSQYGSCTVDGDYTISDATPTVLASTIAPNADYGNQEINNFCVVSGCPTITVTTADTDASCPGVCDGSSTASASGGTPPYTYSWSSGGNAATETGLCAGTYTVTATDAGGCTGDAIVVINEPSALVITSTATGATCNGTCDGSATGSTSGGTTPYTYSWSSGGSGATETGLCAGTYTVTVTDANGCTVNDVVVVTEPVVLLAAASGVDETCNGSCDGLAVGTATGGTSPYTYSWSSGGSGSTETGLCAGSYTLTVTDANGCTAAANVTISSPPAITATATSTDESCNGSCDGTGTASASGGTPPYTYSWSSGGNSATETGLCAGTYTVTVTDANGCTAGAGITVSSPPAVTVTTTSTDASCNGTCDGSATATAGGGTAPYTYSWSSGGNSATETGLCAGTYTVTVTDGNGCTANDVVVINEPSAVAGSTTATDENCGLCDGSASVTASGGSAPYTYSWSSGGSGTTETNLCAGAYTVTITDANGCTGSAIATVGSSGGPTLSTSSTDASCNGSCDGSATVTATGGTPPYTYSWSSGGTGSTETGLCAGTYSVTVTDASGCAGVENVTVNEPSAISSGTTATNATCGNCDGTTTVTASGGTPPYTYQWDAGTGNQTTATATNLCAGVYNVVITDANGCTSGDVATVGATGGPTVTATGSDASCNGVCDGIAFATVSGGTPPYSYSWSSGGTGATENGLCAGTYTVTVTDASGCTGDANVVINEPSAIIVTATSTDASCNGVCDGTATATAGGGSAPYTYSWSSGGNAATETGLCAGTYTVTVTDANGCTMDELVTISEPPAMTASSSSTDATCGNCDGTATITVSGGAAPYTYNWTPAPGGGQGTATATGLCAGSYTVDVTDANGCLGSFIVTVSNVGGPAVVATTIDVTCNGLCDGSATVTATGGTPPYTYLWSSGGTGSTETNLCAGTYSVTITDDNGCASATNVTINEPSAMTLSASVTDELLGNDGAIDLTVTGGTTPYTYAWSPGGQITEDISGLAGGTYTVYVTDANGCLDSLMVTVGSSVGILDNDNSISFSIYPNPGDGNFNLMLKDLNDENISIDLTDVQGKLIWSAQINGLTGDHLKAIDLTNQADGVYFLRIINEKTVSSARIIKH